MINGRHYRSSPIRRGDVSGERFAGGQIPRPPCAANDDALRRLSTEGVEERASPPRRRGRGSFFLNADPSGSPRPLGEQVRRTWAATLSGLSREEPCDWTDL